MSAIREHDHDQVRLTRAISIGLGPDPHRRDRAHSGHRLPCQRRLVHDRTERRDERLRQCRSGVGALRCKPRIQDRARVHAVRGDRFRCDCRPASWSRISRRITSLASSNFEKIATAAGALNEEDVNRVRQKLGELKLAFGYLADEQAELGFTEDEGTRKRLDEAAAGIEQAINDGMTWIAQVDREKLLLSLLTMRRQEAQYRLNSIKRHLGTVLQGVPRVRRRSCADCRPRTS